MDSLASLSNSLGNLVFVISRQEIELGDTSGILSSLQRLLSSRDTVLSYRNRIEVFIDGYNSVKEELFDIPEVRQFVFDLDTLFPYWFYFISKLSSSLHMLILCLTEFTHIKPGLVQCDPLSFSRFIDSHKKSLEILVNNFSLNDNVIAEVGHELIQYLEYWNTMISEDNPDSFAPFKSFCFLASSSDEPLDVMKAITTEMHSIAMKVNKLGFDTYSLLLGKPATSIPKEDAQYYCDLRILLRLFFGEKIPSDIRAGYRLDALPLLKKLSKSLSSINKEDILGQFSSNAPLFSSPNQATENTLPSMDTNTKQAEEYLSPATQDIIDNSSQQPPENICHFIAQVKAGQSIKEILGKDIINVESFYESNHFDVSISKCLKCGQHYIRCFKEYTTADWDDDCWTFWIPADESFISSLKSTANLYKYITDLLDNHSHICWHPNGSVYWATGGSGLAFLP